MNYAHIEFHPHFTYTLHYYVIRFRTFLVPKSLIKSMKVRK